MWLDSHDRLLIRQHRETMPASRLVLVLLRCRLVILLRLLISRQILVVIRVA